MVKDHSIFENRFVRKLYRGNKGRIFSFLEKERKKYCDDCLSLILRITPRQQVNQICRKLQYQGLIIREKGVCFKCGKYKIVNYLKELKLLNEAKRTLKSIAERRTLAFNESQIRSIISKFLGISLSKERLSIYGKEKEFDLVNIENRVVGDIKSYRYSGATPSAEFSTICEYVWLMEKLEESSREKWTKIIVGSGNREIFEKYARIYHPWLGNVEIYFVDNTGKVEKIRDGIKIYV